ncbi:uncharacterized protein OCT59_009716 [Rhizophagus irregularis]|uniref:Hsp70 family protein n=2 Tax=Rhizophagus irregularis TaxID=588596 RepID=A0A015IS19_RHIIW|nr:hypothetical protein RirG_183890 [Rhizophagus irregularis DAOM 197198w]UZO18402.1 hypothetical protein OCT59_009716 [Rhizophagus irregularis]
MTNERSKDNSSENFISNKSHDFIGKFVIGFNKLNNEFINLLEENQNIKQQYKNLEEKNQEISYLNSELNEKNQKILHTNSNLIEKNNKISRNNFDLKEKLEEKDKQFKKLQQYALNLEKQRNEELQLLKQFEIISKNLEKNLEILKLKEIDDDNIIKTFKENNEDFLSSFLNKNLEKSLPYSNIEVIVGLDFGATYSGFSYCHVSNKQNIRLNKVWSWEIVQFKTNTVLQYDDDYNNVVLWGSPALDVKSNHQVNNQNCKRNKPIELFKLCFNNLDENLKPTLPIDYKKAIADYLKEIGKVIKDTLATHWNVDFFENVLLVLTIPAEYSEKDYDIMRECAHDANLINDKSSKNLQFITEPEAAAIYCMENELQEDEIGTTFIVVDCGGVTVDLTARKLIGNNPLQYREITERIGDFYGSVFIDNEFIKFLREKLGTRAIDLLMENNYDQFQCLMQEFCQHIKDPFTGDDTEFNYTLDIKEKAPLLLSHVNRKTKKIMKKNEWLININYDDIKSMFDPIIDGIICLIHSQLSNNKDACSTIFLVGGFSENRYLQKRIKQEFNRTVKNISVPVQPIAAIAHGAVIYGLSIKSNGLNNNSVEDNKKNIDSSRVLKYTFGIDVDSLYGKSNDVEIHRFLALANRGTAIELDQTFSFNFEPEFNQRSENFAIYYTKNDNVQRCDEPEVVLLGVLEIILPDVYNRSINFGLTFGQKGITAFARNELNGQNYTTTFCYPNNVF